jgi:endoglucanase
MLEPLAVDGRCIVGRGSGDRKLLRGVNLSGMEYSHEPYAGVTREELDIIVGAWGANIVRVPFVQSLVLNGGGRGYVDELRELVDWIEERGAYTILDLQWLDRETIWGPGDNRVPPEPNEGSLRCWDQLAKTFRGGTAVVFDLFNEPHDIPLATWLSWAEEMAGVVRAVDAERVLMVGGMDWAYDLRDVEIQLGDVVYSTHVYPGKGPNWDGAFGTAALRRCVFAGEWGGEEKDLDWGVELARYFEELGMGWTAWSWRDYPHLQRSGVATPFGAMVRSELRAAAEARERQDS